jgi:hypothetical protein
VTRSASATNGPCGAGTSQGAGPAKRSSKVARSIELLATKLLMGKVKEIPPTQVPE